MLLASRGIDVLGIDVSRTAIDRARQKATERGLDADFQVGNVLALHHLGRTFATIIDSGVFHTFSDEDRVRYVASLASVMSQQVADGPLSGDTGDEHPILRDPG